MKTKIPVARLWHKKGKLEYYTMFQLKKHFPDLTRYIKHGNVTFSNVMLSTAFL